jgi:DNA-directed RNA polymerase subunit L
MDMKLIVKKTEPNYIELEIEGEEHSLPNALREILVEDNEVEFAAYRIPHPQIGKPTLYVRTKGKRQPLDLIGNALKKLKKSAIEFKSEMKTAKKPKEGKSK